MASKKNLEDIKKEALKAQSTPESGLKRPKKRVKKTAKVAKRTAKKVEDTIKKNSPELVDVATSLSPTDVAKTLKQDADAISKAAKPKVDAIGKQIEQNYKRSNRFLNRLLRQHDISKNIFIAFAVNLIFAAIELIGGLLSGSVAILSDAVHDLGDAIAIGFSYFMEKKSKEKPNRVYTYGYARYSVLGAFATTLIVAIGSALILVMSIIRLMSPITVYPAGMIILAIIGIIVNGYATYRTRGEDSLNQRAVNLHMLEDVLGWIVVLIGGCLIALTGVVAIDPLMSIGIAIYVLVQAIRNFRKVLDLFLEKTPNGLSVEVVKAEVLAIPHVKDVHHLHLWGLDENSNYATLHVVTDGSTRVKPAIREALKKSGITHVTIEVEAPKEKCTDKTHKIEKVTKPNKSDEYILKIKH